MYKVTREHIDDGVASCTISCPIALCLRENVHENIAVSRGHIYSSDPLNEYARHKCATTYLFSNAIRGWIEKFDLGHDVPEFEFVIDGIDVYMKGEQRYYVQ